MINQSVVLNKEHSVSFSHLMWNMGQSWNDFDERKRLNDDIMKARNGTDQWSVNFSQITGYFYSQKGNLRMF